MPVWEMDEALQRHDLLGAPQKRGKEDCSGGWKQRPPGEGPRSGVPAASLQLFPAGRQACELKRQNLSQLLPA